MNRLKELRKEKGLSQKALANELGVHYRTLQNWENGESNIKPEKAKLLADYFSVPVSYLLGYDDNLTIGDTIESLEAVYAGDIPSNDEMVEKTITHQKKTDKEIQEIIEKNCPY